MKYQVYSKNLDVTDALKQYIDMRLSNLDKLHKEIISCQIDLGRDQRHRKGDVFRIEINLSVPDKLLRVVEKHADVRAGIDIATDKLFRRFKKHIQKKRSLDRKWLQIMRRKS